MNDRERGQQRSIRLPGWDYRQAGAYFVTIVTQGRECLFDQPILRRVVETRWQRIADRPRVELDAWVVMPNHVHGIMVISGETAAPATGGAEGMPDLVAGSLGAIVNNLKSVTTRIINVIRHTPGLPVWQRNYYERIIRSERELQATRQYILANPARWAEDSENPLCIPR